MNKFGWAVLVVVSGAGCATTSKWGGATTMAEERFPARSELQQVAMRAPKLDTAKHDVAVVESWTLEGPFPNEAAITPVAPSNAWEKALQQAVPSVGNVLSVELQCVSREVARFMAARTSYPGNSLQTFIQRRCGSTAPHVGLRSLSGEIPDGVTEAQWVTEWTDGLTKMANAVGTPDVAGISVRREGTHGVLVLAYADVMAKFEKPIPLVGANGTVLIRGRLAKGGAERISAAINKGVLDVETCKTVDALQPPEFAFECPVPADDQRTTLELGLFQPGRILGETVTQQFLWPKGNPSNTWSQPKGGGEVPAGAFDNRFLAAVNELRVSAKLPPMALAKEQSDTAKLLAPHYFSASFGEGDPLDADRVALGMMAGWDVGVDIVSSGFGSEWVSGSRDVQVFMEFVLDSPFQRKSVTNPKATLLAVGSVETAASSLAAIFATYVPLQKFDRKESEVAIITRLNQLRIDRQLKPAQWTLWPADEGAVVEANLAAKRWTPKDAAQHALERTAEVARGRVNGYVQLVDDLENFQFPPEVLMRPDINVFLAVGVYRHEDWAQSRYVVCFVISQAGDIETASR